MHQMNEILTDLMEKQILLLKDYQNVVLDLFCDYESEDLTETDINKLFYETNLKFNNYRTSNDDIDKFHAMNNFIYNVKLYVIKNKTPTISL